MINIFDDLNNILHAEDLYYKATVSDETEVYLDTVISDDISDEELDLEVDVDEHIIDEVIFGVVEKSKIHQRTLKFWEVYVDDEGNLVRYLRQTYPDVEAQFSLP
jgi:hypothetical protein